MFDTTYSRYGRALSPLARAYQAWSSGLVAANVMKETPIITERSQSTLAIGCDESACRSTLAVTTSCTNDNTSNPTYTPTCVRRDVRVISQCAVKYPSRSAH